LSGFGSLLSGHKYSLARQRKLGLETGDDEMILDGFGQHETDFEPGHGQREIVEPEPLT
jgi:hypothetical protein